MSTEPVSEELANNRTTEERISDLQNSSMARFWLSAIIESADDAIISKSLEGVIMSWNRGAERIFGYTADEVIGKSVTILIPADHIDEEPRILARIRSGQRIEHYETIRVRKDGTLVNISLTVSPIKDGSGKILGASKIARDISQRVRAEEELNETRRQLETVFNNATVSLFIMDKQQHCTYMNPAAERLTGYTLSEVQGRPLHDFIHHTRPDGRPYPLEECPIDQALPHNSQEQGEEVFVHKDGSFISVAFTASPIREADSPIGTIIEVRDTTEEKRAARERERLLQLEQEAREETETINRLGQLISAELDLHKIVQAVTDAATELTGARFGSFFYNVLNEEGASYMLYTLSGVPREAFAHFPMPRATDLFGPTFRGEGVVRIDDVKLDPRYGNNSPYYGMPEGHLPVTSYLAVPVISRSGEVLGGLFFGHPEAGVFTERHERMVAGLSAQGAIAMDNARLYESVKRAREEAERVAMENERLYREAQESSRLKDEFLATISHELRTPLTAILGWSHMLRTGQFSSESSLKALETIERNARAQGQLIDDLLDVSRIITGKLRIDVRPVDPNSFIEAAIEAVRPAAEARGVRVQKIMDTGVISVAGDPIRLQQVVWNLLSNAIKFTPRDGRVQVRLERVNSHIEIAVSDTGSGISQEFLPHVFDRFRQADQRTTRQHGGMGLGLSIVRHLVELHGGSVRAESEGLGKGSTFTVLLPVAPVYQSEMPTERVHPAARDTLPSYECAERLDGLRVLVVDDEPDTRELLKTGLTQCGAEVSTAKSAMEALEAIEAATPDLLISDIGMPDMDGYELMKMIRELGADKGGRVPAIALTAYARTEDRLQALRAGYQMHVPKPVELAELVAVASSLVQRSS
ncbi:MAG TPA: PAS domain S-box protein [Pyrinomonadaceae bacterium]|nr:PAS domain S-box protein [Pyrinomonadaceae bacterium]